MRVVNTRRALLAAWGISGLVGFIVLFFVGTINHREGITQRPLISTGWGFLIELPFLIFLAITCVVIFLWVRGGFRFEILLPRLSRAYSRLRFDAFSSALDAVSLGVGLSAPPLVVLDIPFPDSYVAVVKGKTSIVVTPALLDMALTGQEVEAVMATGLARMIDSRDAPAWRDVHERLKVDSEITERMISFAPDVAVRYRSMLRADTLAAKITGQPGALRSAMMKFVDALNGYRMSHAGRYRRMAYVEIPPSSVFNKPSDAVNEELIKLRLANFEEIESGKMPDFSVVRDARPVVQPEGWE